MKTIPGGQIVTSNIAAVRTRVLHHAEFRGISPCDRRCVDRDTAATGGHGQNALVLGRRAIMVYCDMRVPDVLCAGCRREAGI